MNLSKAKAFNGFILEAKNAFDRVFNRKVTEEELEQIKATYTVAEIERYKAEFDAELFRNHMEYMDEELLYEYIQMNLKPIRSINFNLKKTEILRNGFEVSYLVGLMKAIEVQSSFVDYLMQTMVSYDEDISKDVIYYSNLSDHLGELSLAYNSVDGLGKLINEVKSMPPRDSRFNFEFLIVECNMLESNTERIKLITARLYEFEQWKIQNEKSLKRQGILLTDYDSILYPNFEKLCHIEIEKLQKLDAIEKSAQATETPEMQSKTTVGLSASDYVWKSSATDLLELAAALYQNKSVERKDEKPLTRKELIGYFEQMFNIEITDIEHKLTKASGRDNNTWFLDNLSQQFRNYVAGKEAKMLKRR